jgi:hypothetical protein
VRAALGAAPALAGAPVIPLRRRGRIQLVGAAA